MELVEANWPLVLVALGIAIVIAWWAFIALRRISVVTYKTDILDEGQGPAARNQALIDAGPAAAVEAPVAVPTAKIMPETPPLSTRTAADDLSRIKGVGPKLAAILHDQNITSFAQIAAWSDADIDAIDAKMGRFEGRIRRDNWREQAKFLAADDSAGYENKFGKL